MASLGICDTALRLWAPGRLYYRPEEQFIRVGPDWEDSIRFDRKQLIAQDTYGDLAHFSCDESLREYRQITFATDELGFRNFKHKKDRPVEIILLGDSFAMGSGTTQDKTLGSLLADQTKTNVYNLSIPSTPREQAINLLAESLKLNLGRGATLVWVLFEGNDLNDFVPIIEPLRAKPRSSLEKLTVMIGTLRGRSPIHKLLIGSWQGCVTSHLVLSRDIAPVGPVLFYKPYEESLARPESSVQSSIGWANIVQVFKTVADTARALDLKVLVAVAPTKEQVYVQKSEGPSLFSNLLREQASALDFDFLDLKPNLVKEGADLLNERTLLYWRDDTHWNEFGHQVVAQAIAAHLERAH